ncbi:ATP-binding protein [Roseateles sp. BYS180W]|uniref:histidine kinase n=1 Tax=Roseateles rivi TaxID=3299028 RepID=A0ABW7FWM1_9BURK
MQQELLALLHRQSRRSPLPVAVSALVLVCMAWQAPEARWAAGAWFVAVLSVLALRWVMLARLPTWVERSLAQRLRWASGLSLLNGSVYGAFVVLWPSLNDYQHMVQTVLLLGLCAASVATVAGNARVLGAFVLPMVGSLAAGWAWSGWAGGRPPWTDWTIAGLVLGFGATLMMLARDVYRVFVDSVLIRQQQAQHNRELRQSLDRTQAAVSAKTRFLAAASHDLRQPMHTLTLFGAALSRRNLDDASRAIVAQMNQALQSLSTQLDTLLDISKLDADVVPVHPQRFALLPWLQRIANEQRPSALRKGLQLQLQCPAQACVDTDPALLERVVRNLLDNAIKYTYQGQVQLLVQAQDDEEWQIHIIDTGPGIAQSEHSRVFDEFYQIDNPERDREKGLGLGLSIVSRLVDLLDLNLRLRSSPGQGCCFTLHIPQCALPQQSHSNEGGHSQLTPLTVLVVDNEAPVREAMGTLLQAMGCTVLLADSTREAMLRVLSRTPDLALVDLRLRGSDDGLSTVRSLRTAFPGLPAVIVTGDTAPEVLRRVHDAGLEMLHKPVSEERLTAVIKTAAAHISN